MLPRGRCDSLDVIRVSPLTPFIILKWGKGCFHSHNSSWLAAGRMVLKFSQASVSRSRPLRTEINPRGSGVGANFKHQPGPVCFRQAQVVLKVCPCRILNAMRRASRMALSVSRSQASSNGRRLLALGVRLASQFLNQRDA